MRKRKPSGWPKRRPNTGKVYGAMHRRIRKALLAEEPNCRMCADEGQENVPAVIADHIVPVCLGGPTVRENYQSLCRDHALTKTAREGAMVRWARKRARKRQAERDRS